MLPSLLILLLLSFLAYVVMRWKLRRFHRISSELPGPPNYPLIGSAHLLIGKSNHEIFNTLQDVMKTYTSPCRVWLGPKIIVLIDNPVDAQVILNSPDCLERADMYRFVGSVKGLFSSPASLWKVHRKLLAPSFSPSILNSFTSIINKKSKILLRHLEKNIGEEAFNVYGDVARCTLDIICATFLKSNKDFQSNIGTKIVEMIEQGSDLIYRRMYSFWLHPDWIYQKTNAYKEQMECFEKTHSIIRDIMNEEQNQSTESDIENDNLKKPQIFIDLVMQLAQKTDIFDEIAVLDELSTILVGGNETSALTLSHTILLLAIHPEIQEKVYNEIVAVLGTSDPSTPVSHEDILKLNYTEMAIKESMRLFPIGAIIGRKTTAPTRISKSTIPTGTNIILGIYNIHRNPKYWGPDVDSFNPDHFLPERVAERHPYTFLPFSGGQRNCVGYKFAHISMKIILCYLLRAYRFRSPLKMEQLQVTVSIALKIANMPMVTVEKRNV